MIPSAMEHDYGTGAWLYFDEMGAAEPQILVRVNRLFEKFGRLELSENGNRMVEAGGEFRLFSSTNPPEYAGRLPFAPDFLRRWNYQKVGGLSESALEDRLAFLFRGPQEGKDWNRLIQKMDIVTARPLDLRGNSELSKAIEEFLKEFFIQCQKAATDGTVGRNQRQQFRYEFSDCIRVHQYLAMFGGDDPLSALRSATTLYFANKVVHVQERNTIITMIDTVMAAKDTQRKIREALGSAGAGEPEVERLAREAAERALADLGGIL